MARTYSHRFHHVFGPAPVQRYLVPPGCRAVVKTIAALNERPAGAYVWVAVAGIYVFARPLPAVNSSWSEDVRLVVYEGEELALASLPDLCAVTITGYLFEDVDRELQAGQLPAPPAPAEDRPQPKG